MVIKTSGPEPHSCSLSGLECLGWGATLKGNHDNPAPVRSGDGHGYVKVHNAEIFEPPEACWKLAACLWLPGSQWCTYTASGVRAVLLGFFRRVFRFPQYFKKRIKLSLNLYCLWYINRDWNTSSCSSKWKSPDYFSCSGDRLNFTYHCICIFRGGTSNK